jgi:hypothetical protein
MTKIKLDVPANSRFKSSLNEHDMAIKAILINQMRLADPRSKLGKPDSIANNEQDYLWDKTRIFQVDNLDIEDIFDTYLLRKEINNLKGTDVTYPLLAYKEENIETVFWGTGNRIHQHYIETEVNKDVWKVGDSVVVVSPEKYRGFKGTLDSITSEGYTVRMGQDLIYDRIGTKLVPHLFSIDDLKQAEEKNMPKQFKAKGITTKYSGVILADNRDEIQYIRDHYMLRIADSHIWWEYDSPVLGNSVNNIFTVFGIPNIEKYTTAKDKLNGKGYVYGTAFTINTWAVLTDTPLPTSYIDSIRMSITVEPDGRDNRIVIN